MEFDFRVPNVSNFLGPKCLAKNIFGVHASMHACTRARVNLSIVAVYRTFVDEFCCMFLTSDRSDVIRDGHESLQATDAS